MEALMVSRQEKKMLEKFRKRGLEPWDVEGIIAFDLDKDIRTITEADVAGMDEEWFNALNDKVAAFEKHIAVLHEAVGKLEFAAGDNAGKIEGLQESFDELYARLEEVR